MILKKPKSTTSTTEAKENMELVIHKGHMRGIYLTTARSNDDPSITEPLGIAEIPDEYLDGEGGLEEGYNLELKNKKTGTVELTSYNGPDFTRVVHLTLQLQQIMQE